MQQPGHRLSGAHLVQPPRQSLRRRPPRRSSRYPRWLRASRFPDGSVDTAATAESPDMELWEPTVSYEATVAHLAGHLPSGQDFDGLRWCQKTVSNSWRRHPVGMGDER